MKWSLDDSYTSGIDKLLKLYLVATLYKFVHFNWNIMILYHNIVVLSSYLPKYTIKNALLIKFNILSNWIEIVNCTADLKW
jgi:hypothetical protein